jgi:hypothetical protein
MVKIGTKKTAATRGNGERDGRTRRKDRDLNQKNSEREHVDLAEVSSKQSSQVSVAIHVIIPLKVSLAVGLYKPCPVSHLLYFMQPNQINCPRIL